MTDPEDRKLDQLLENINQLRADVEDGFSGLRKDNRTTNERITKQSQTFRDDQNRVINRLDLVAAQVVKVGDDVTEVKEILSEHTDGFEKIERRLDAQLDRVDQHHQRISAVEAKTRHLPTPTK
jgi:chromosome segregation ATPase